MRQYNAGAIAGLDTRLRRRGRSFVRLDAWLSISAAELRPPPAEARDLLACKPAARKIAGDLTVSVRHPRLPEVAQYRVHDVPGARAGGTVRVQPLMCYEDGTILVTASHGGETYVERRQPIALDLYAQPLDAPTWGEYQPRADTEAERRHKRIREVAGEPKPGAAALDGQAAALDALTGERAGERKVVAFPVRGQPSAAPKAQVLGVVEAARRARELLGERWTGELLGEIRRRWPKGAPAAELDRWAADLASAEETG